MHRVVALYLAALGTAGLLVVIGFTLARSIPPDALLVVMMVAFCFAAAGVVFLDRASN